MRLLPFSMLALLSGSVTFACASGRFDGTSGETGGTLGSAGNQTTLKGGSSGGGNASTSGGSPGSGGTVSSSGGSSGGNLFSGGSGSTSGGSGSSSQGGNLSSGGTTASGGGGASGGSAPRGGSPGNGGNAGSGGSSGNTAKGGAGGSTGQGGNAGSSGSGNAGSGSGGAAVQCNPPQGTTGYTTRFWDCCKPSCSWPGNVGGRNPVKSCNQQNQTTGSSTASACSGGGAFACWDMAPWAVSDTLAYGYAAFNGGNCGQCYELKFTGQSNSTANEPGAATLCGKTMVVQVINIGNIAQGQFDLMIPGGGVGQFNACSTQWGVSGSALGEQYGGVQLTCQRQNADYAARKSCTETACNNLFKNSNQTSLLNGCKWGVDWLGAADNPKVVYKQVNCPNELTSKSGLQ